MAQSTTNPESELPWHTSRHHSGLVPLRNNTLTLSAIVNGRPRPPSTTNEPLIILLPGIGGTAAEYVLISQLLAPFARILRYDRAGYGCSSTQDPTLLSSNHPAQIPMSRSAEDLYHLLQTLALAPPYLLVGQSFGGILARDFIRQYGGTGDNVVCGLVLIDAFPLRPFQGIAPLRAVVGTLCASTPFEEVTGLWRNTVLTPEQMEAVHRDMGIAVENGTLKAELDGAVDSETSVNAAQGIRTTLDAEGLVSELEFTSQPLGTGRLSVLIGGFPSDIRKTLEFGRRVGNGDQETYRLTERILELMDRTVAKFQRAQIGLTAGLSRATEVTGPGVTHDLHMTRPEVVAEEIRWVLEGGLAKSGREN